MKDKRANTERRLKYERFYSRTGQRPCKRCCNSYREQYSNYCERCNEKIELQNRIQKTIPKLYWPARIRHLPDKVRKVINCSSNGKGIFLWGILGVGKTYGMAALARKYIVSGFSVEWVSWLDVVLQIRSTFNRPKIKTDGGGYTYNEEQEQQTEMDIIMPLIEADKLFIEDIDTGKAVGSVESDFSVKTLYYILNERVNAERPTFITSNKTIEELEQSFDDRIVSRIKAGCRIREMAGKDRRKDS